MTRLSARTVMITGGVSGLGLAMASAFAATGAHLYVGGQMSDKKAADILAQLKQKGCLLYTSPSPRDRTRSRMPSSA